MKKKIKILTSWDDADQLDLTLADMLLKYEIPAVFYVPVKTRDLEDSQLRKLAGTEPNCDICEKTKRLFEIGCHTMTHPEDLKKLSDKELKYEIEESKKALEYLIHRPVTKFCYPKGKFDERVKEVVMRAGFKEARTVRVLNTKFPKDPLETNTSVHIHPDRKEYEGRSWKEVAEELLEEVLEEGGRFEVWGHSQELEKFHQWEFLDDFLWYCNKKLKEIDYPRDIGKELKV